VACGGGDEPSDEPALELPEGAIAFVDTVDDGEITQAEVDAALDVTAASQGSKDVPTEGTPEYDAVLTPAVSELILSRWIRGEAEELEITTTDAEVDAQLDTIIDTTFKGQGDFDMYLENSNLTEEDARERVELSLLAEAIQEEVLSDLSPEEQEEAITEYQDEFRARWRERTVCSEDLIEGTDGAAAEAGLGPSCSNFELPDVDEVPQTPPDDPADTPPSGSPQSP
jgi:hypothetical protein